MAIDRNLPIFMKDRDGDQIKADILPDYIVVSWWGEKYIINTSNGDWHNVDQEENSSFAAFHN